MFPEEVYLFFYSKAGIGEIFEGHQGPVTGINCHMAVGPVDFSHLFVTSSFDWTVKLWTTKVRSGSEEAVPQLLTTCPILLTIQWPRSSLMLNHLLHWAFGFLKKKGSYVAELGLVPQCQILLDRLQTTFRPA